MLTTEVAARLERKLGVGAFPLVRRRLYQRLQRLAVAHGDPVLQIIGQVEMEALGDRVRDQGQYFCFVVKRRLGELGYPLDAVQGSPPAVPPANKLRSVVAELAGKQSVAVQDQKAVDVERQRIKEELAKLKRAAAVLPGEGGAW
jgi:hypothetical protein